MNYSAMVTTLKSTIEDETHSASTVMLLEALNVIKNAAKKPNEHLDEITQQLHRHLIASAKHKWSLYRYFSGEGPVARKLKDYAAITNAYSMGSFKLNDHIKKFDFEPTTDENEKGHTFREWLEDVAINMFEVPHTFACPCPYDVGIEIGFDTGIAIQGLQYTEDEQPIKWLTIAVELDNGIQAKYVVKQGADAKLLYWHPHEEVWLADDATTLIPGVWEAMKEQWDTIADQAGFKAKPVNIVEATNEMIKKADRIFDNADKIPEVTEAYIRNGDETYIRFVAEHYHLVFTNIGGKWPARYWTLSFNMGDAHSTTIGFEDMREFARQDLINRATAGLDSLITRFVDVAPIAIPDAQAERAEEAANAEVDYGRSFNPVYRAQQRAKEKK
jgi:hypothetical protein